MAPVALEGPSGGGGTPPEALIIRHTPMLTCRSIPEAEWQKARKLLVFYFGHRGVANAEDLAQETLAEVLRRDDYQFERQEDFTRVCYAFASRVFQAACRRKARNQTAEFDENQVAPGRGAFGMHSSEMTVFLNEVIATGSSE